MPEIPPNLPDWLLVLVAALQAVLTCVSVVVAVLVYRVAGRQARAMEQQRVALDNQVEASLDAIRATYRPYIAVLRMGPAKAVHKTTGTEIELTLHLSCTGQGAAFHLKGRIFVERFLRGPASPPDWENQASCDVSLVLDRTESPPAQRQLPAQVIPGSLLEVPVILTGTDFLGGTDRSAVLFLEYRDVGLEWWLLCQPFTLIQRGNPGGDAAYGLDARFDPSEGCVGKGRLPDKYPPGDAP